MKRFATLFAVLSVCLFCGVAGAKEAADAPEGGAKTRISAHQWGMNFAIPTGNKGSIGLMYVINPNLLLEADLGFSYLKEGGGVDAKGDPQSTWGYLFGPAIRYYFMGSGPVNIYFKGALQYADNKDADAQVSLFGGLGVEWFVTKYFSIGGDTGLAIQVMPSEDLGVGSVSHGLSANIYW